MRRFDKIKHIQNLNRRLNESFRPEDIPSPSQEEVDQQIAKFKGGDEEEINELSSDKVMGAANKMWQSQNGGNQFENPRAKKLLQTYSQKLHGMKLFGGEIDHTAVELVRNNKDNKGEHAVGQLVVYINSTNNNSNAHQGGGIFYNYSTDQFMNGHSFGHGMVPYDTPVSKFDARQLSKIAAHFNPKTRYAHYERELNIQVEGAIEEYDEDRVDYDYDNRDGYHSPFDGEEYQKLSETFEKLCGVKILKENTNDGTYFETLAGAIDAVEKMAEKMGYTLDDEAVWNEFGTGGVPYETNREGTIPLLKDGKPIVGKRGKPLNRAIHVSLYRMPSGKYELTAYKTW